MKKAIALFLGLTLHLLSYAAGDSICGGSTPDCILPQVDRWIPANGGNFVLKKGATYRLQTKEASSEEINTFKAYVEASPLSLREAGKKRTPEIKITVRKNALKDMREGAYVMTIDRNGIRIQANGLAGAFYALQSLLQLQDADDEGRICACIIEDAPRYPYRGLMFDLVRHFHSKEFILKQVDLMCQLKMNRLHLHLTDNEAWRIELDCAPEMVQKGAFGDSWWFNHIMNRTPLRFADKPDGYVPGSVYDDGKVYGGYYSKEDMREIIAYAAARHIEIIPEIELPGHNMALLNVHPEFFCTGEHKVNNVICVGQEEVFLFFEKVLAEVMELFPSKYMHIGGDEANKLNWEICPLCRTRIKNEALKDVFELQSYCIRRMEKFINAQGKKLIGWDEILEGGLSENATVMSWRGTEGGVESIRMHHDVIMTPSTYYYLDYAQDAPFKEPLAFNTYLPLKVVYDYEPEADIIAACGGRSDPSIMKHLLGVQANLWGECIVDSDHFEYMLYPRAFAVAETGWSPKGSKDYPSFREKALILCKRFNEKGYHCFDLSCEAGPRPEATKRIASVAIGSKATMVIGKKEPERVDVLVDGYLGGYALKKSPDWKEYGRHEVTIDIDLDESKDLHYIGAEFVDYNMRRFPVPADNEFSVSEDGVNYTPVPIPSMKLSKGRQHYYIIMVGGTVNVRARYVRLRFNRGDNKGRGYISEVIIN